MEKITVIEFCPQWADETHYAVKEAQLLQDLKNGTQKATAHTTNGGALAIVTEF